jgi:hypothetical protein
LIARADAPRILRLRIIEGEELDEAAARTLASVANNCGQPLEATSR